MMVYQHCIFDLPFPQDFPFRFPTKGFLLNENFQPAPVAQWIMILTRLTYSSQTRALRN